MVEKTKDKNYYLNIVGSILKTEFKHIKENWLVFLVCFFIARTNIIDEIFPFAIVVLCTYCYTMGISVLMLIVTITAILSVQFNFVYIIMLIAVFAYFASFESQKKSILYVAGYSSLVLLVSKTTILVNNGFNVNGLMLNLFETVFVFSSIILLNEIIRTVKKIKNDTKKDYVQRFIKETKKRESAPTEPTSKISNIVTFRKLDKKKISRKAEQEAAPTQVEEKTVNNSKNIRHIVEYKKNKQLNILSEKAKLKIKEQLLWQNINVKFYDVLTLSKSQVLLSITVKTEKPCEEAESAIELIVRNVCGIKLKCTERLVASPNYYVLKFKNIKRIKIRTYSASAVKGGSTVSGDNFAFAGRSDRYYTVLCDGIGSGEEAFNESNSAVDLLSKFMYTDFSEEQILRTLNSILMIKLGDERFVTFDFNVIDYGSRELRLYKAGAAPTYIISGNTVDKVSGKSLPLGILDNFEYSSFKKKIEIGDKIIMVSDGIVDSIGLDEKKSLDKYMELIMHKDPQTIANSILSYAIRGQDALMDDMTVLVTKIG